MKNLPAVFIQRIIATWGKPGEQWLSNLPPIIEELAKKWQLTDIKLVSHLSYNFVAFASQKDKTPVVLKIACDAQAIANEYAALQHFNNHGAIRVLDFNRQHNALLLGQAMPGFSLKEHSVSNITEAIKIYASVVEALANQSLATHSFPHMREWCKALDHIIDPRIESRLVTKAQQLRTDLLNLATQEYLCHGDLHCENILKHHENWLAIDPKGVIAEKAFEAAAFDFISQSELKNSATAQEKIFSRSAQLANALNVQQERLLAWAFVRTTLAAQWFVEDKGDPTNKLILATHLFPYVETLSTNFFNCDFQ